MSHMNFCKLSNLKKLAQSYLSLMLSTEYSRTIQTLNYLQDFYYRPKTQNTKFIKMCSVVSELYRQKWPHLNAACTKMYNIIDISWSWTMSKHKTMKSSSSYHVMTPALVHIHNLYKYNYKTTSIKTQQNQRINSLIHVSFCML